jgi:hypothetical protein
MIKLCVSCFADSCLPVRTNETKRHTFGYDGDIGMYCLAARSYVIVPLELQTEHLLLSPHPADLCIIQRILMQSGTKSQLRQLSRKTGVRSPAG